jgi:hypothetical protein
MDEPTIFANTAPSRGIRVAQAADILFRVVNDDSFTGVAFHLVNHCSSGIHGSISSSGTSTASMKVWP